MVSRVSRRGSRVSSLFSAMAIRMQTEETSGLEVMWSVSFAGTERHGPVILRVVRMGRHAAVTQHSGGRGQSGLQKKRPRLPKPNQINRKNAAKGRTCH